MSDGVAARYDVHDAAADFARIIERVEHGEEVVICREGLPVARIVPLDTPVRRTRRGSPAGRLDMAADWNAPTTSEIIARDFG